MAEKQWQLTGASEDAGWLAIPALETAAEAAAWVDEHAAAIRQAWGETWQPEHDEVVRALLAAGLEHRRPDDALCFQVWPTNAPVCIFVHAAVGQLAPDDRLPEAGEGILYEADGLGLGVQMPVVERVDDADVAGVQFLFAQEGLVVRVDVEPTLPELLGLLIPMVHSFVQTVQLTASDGTRFRADAPALLEAEDGESWVDSLTEP